MNGLRLCSNGIEGEQGICPNGWHIPTKAEFEELRLTVNSNSNSLKKVGQGSGFGEGSDESGFSAILAGGRADWGNFFGIGSYANYWSSSEYDSNTSESLFIERQTRTISYWETLKEVGYSIRCVQD